MIYSTQRSLAQSVQAILLGVNLRNIAVKFAEMSYIWMKHTQTWTTIFFAKIVY